MIGVGVGIPFNRTSFGGAPSFVNTNSLLFDGVDEYVNFGNVSSLSNSTNWTISFWAKTSDAQAYWLDFRDSGTENIFINTNNSSNITYFYLENGGASYAQISRTFNNNTWYHFVMAYNGSGATNSDKLQCYIDGVSTGLSYSGTIPSVSPTLSANMWVMRLTTNYTSGNMDELSVFDYTLNATQVTSIYNSGTPTDLNNTSGVTAPVHWWRMGDGDTFPTINDVGTTGGNNGTMTNMESGDIVTDTP